jgi:hypothetical protein
MMCLWSPHRSKIGTLGEEEERWGGDSTKGIGTLSVGNSKYMQGTRKGRGVVLVEKNPLAKILDTPKFLTKIITHTDTMTPTPYAHIIRSLSERIPKR